MSKASNYLENKLTDHIFRGVTFTAPTGLYVALHSGDPTDLGTGTEISGGAYARVLVTPSTGNWSGTQGATTTAVSSGTGGASSNNATITFPAPTGNWGVCSYFGIWDLAAAGNLVVYGDLGTPKTINNGDAAPSFAISALTVTIA